MSHVLKFSSIMKSSPKTSKENSRCLESITKLVARAASIVSCWMRLMVQSSEGSILRRSRGLVWYFSHTCEIRWRIVYWHFNVCHRLMSVSELHRWWGGSFYFSGFWLWILSKLSGYNPTHTNRLWGCHWALLRQYSIWCRTFSYYTKMVRGSVGWYGSEASHWLLCFYSWRFPWLLLEFPRHLCRILD